MKHITYIFFRVIVFIFSLLPFKVIYLISDFLSFILRKVFKYRLSVVIENLDKSNLNLNPDQKASLVKKIYDNLSDIIVEGIKGNTLSSQEISKRYKIVNPEVLDALFNEKQNLIGIASHYCNWEWGARALPKYIKHKVIGIYKPLSNKYIDKYIKKGRSKDDSFLVDIKTAARSFKNEKFNPGAFILISDQNPTNDKNAIWTHFLGRETAIIQGPDKFANKYNLPVFYVHVTRPKRGFYEATFELIRSKNQKITPGEIASTFMKKLERAIEEKPENWLWTHKRWKHTLKSEEKGKLIN